MTVRVKSGSPVLLDGCGGGLAPVKSMCPLKKPEVIDSEAAWAQVASSGGLVRGRLCSIRTTEEAVRIAQHKLRREVSKEWCQPRPATLETTRCVVVFTNVPEDEWTESEALDSYHTR